MLNVMKNNLIVVILNSLNIATSINIIMRNIFKTKSD
jgi:hypothetical protein